MIARLLGTGTSLCVFLGSLGLSAQLRNGTAASVLAQRGAEAPAQDEVPTYILEFHQGKPIPFVVASAAIADPSQCSPDGVPFVDEIVSPKLRQHAVVSLDPEGGHLFSLTSIPNLYDIRFYSFFPSDSFVAILVTATTDAKDSTYLYQTDKGAEISGTAKLGEHEYYILLFNRDGNYKSMIELPPSSQFYYKKIAVLTSGDLLLAGYDGVNRVPRLRLFDSSGQFLKEIAVPAGMMEDSKLEQGETGGALEAGAAAASISLWQFAQVRDKVVLYQPETAAPVLEIGAGGVAREVPIAAPSGYRISAVLPGTSRWIAKFQREGISMTSMVAVDVSPASGNFVLYEVNPLDGSLRTRLKERGSTSIFDLVCEDNGVLTAIAAGEGMKFIPFTADLAR
jgi:hypothetical protein